MSTPLPPKPRTFVITVEVVVDNPTGNDFDKVLAVDYASATLDAVFQGAVYDGVTIREVLPKAARKSGL